MKQKEARKAVEYLFYFRIKHRWCLSMWFLFQSAPEGPHASFPLSYEHNVLISVHLTNYCVSFVIRFFIQTIREGLG